MDVKNNSVPYGNDLFKGIDDQILKDLGVDKNKTTKNISKKVFDQLEVLSKNKSLKLEHVSAAQKILTRRQDTKKLESIGYSFFSKITGSEKRYEDRSIASAKLRNSLFPKWEKDQVRTLLTKEFQGLYKGRMTEQNAKDLIKQLPIPSIIVYEDIDKGKFVILTKTANKESSIVLSDTAHSMIRATLNTLKEEITGIKSDGPKIVKSPIGEKPVIPPKKLPRIPNSNNVNGQPTIAGTPLQVAYKLLDFNPSDDYNFKALHKAFQTSLAKVDLNSDKTKIQDAHELILKSMVGDAIDFLGLSGEFTPEKLVKAYRAKSLEVHPDKPGGSTEQMQKLVSAYEFFNEFSKNEQNRFYFQR